MDTKDAYNNWAETYDTDVNRTRDMEGRVLRQLLNDFRVENLLEIGCGTGKNTGWLATKCNSLQAVDFSESMLELARRKNLHNHVTFTKADITQEWKFKNADLIVCSLVLEHIADISSIFEQAAVILNEGGTFYISELHPYRQLQGSRAKFEKGGEQFNLDYHVHHISEYLDFAGRSSFRCIELKEWFDDDGNAIPRIVTYLFKKQKSL